MLIRRPALPWIAWLVERDGTIPAATDASNAALVRRAQAGDPNAFEILIRAAGDRLLAVARKILRDPDVADDAFQSATITAWRKLPALRDPERFDGWLYKILVSACYAEANRKRSFAAKIRRVTEPGTTDERLAGLDEREALERAFRSLSPAHRAVVVLHHYVDLPLVEVAGILGVSAGTARSRLHYALRALRSALEADDRGPPMNDRAGLRSVPNDREQRVLDWLTQAEPANAGPILDGILEQLPGIRQVRPERMWRAARADARAPAESGDRLLGAALAQRALPAREEWVRHRGACPGPEISQKRTPRGRAQRHDPFLRALAENVERAVRADVADTQGHELGQSESGVEQEQNKRAFALVRQGQQTAQLRVAERGNQSARDVRPPEGTKARRRGELLRDTPIAEGPQAADVAGD